MRISDWSADVCPSVLCDGIAHQPARLSLNRRNLNIAQRLRHGALTSTRIERTEAAARQAGSNQEQGKEALHTTRLTKRSGTTITFFGVAPSSVRITFADARARRSSSSFGVPLATVSVSRSLPLTCTATVTSSSIDRKSTRLNSSH